MASRNPDSSQAQNDIPSRLAVLLIAHGSRRNEANLDLPRLADAIRARAIYPIVEIAYLELAEPTIDRGGRACVEQGAERVLMLPYFLSAGAHVTDDLDRSRKELAAQFPNIEFLLCRPLSLHPLLVEIVLDRLRDAENG
jgi:sirohydrochlorin ferrochelatase